MQGVKYFIHLHIYIKNTILIKSNTCNIELAAEFYALYLLAIFNISLYTQIKPPVSCCFDYHSLPNI